MRTFPFVAAVVSFISASTFANVIVFDNAEVFNAGLLDSSLEIYGQTFESYSGSAAFFLGGTGDYAWKASSPNGVLGQAGVVQTLSATDTLKFEFSSGNVYGVGGLFHYVDAVGTYQSGLMKIKLSDGTIFIRSITSQTTFSGFITTNASISSLELSHLGSNGVTFSCAETLTIGYVPAPGAVALLGLAGLIGRRRRA
ncbi:MAG: hypothetical protein EXS12_03820 [Phycisphaerales bacterium]|nr:hypothetical protein [Phycisphaerales bacterium]